MNFTDLLAKLEKSDKIMDFKFEKTDIPLYPVIRVFLIQSLINQQYGLSNPHVKPNKKSLLKILEYMFHTIQSNIFLAPQKDIYIFSSGIVNKLENGQYVNRLYDDFNNLFRDNTQIIESSVKLSYLLPKKEQVYFKDFIDILIIIISKAIKKKSEAQIAAFLEYLRNDIHVEISNDIVQQIESNLIKMSPRIQLSYRIYQIWLKWKKPKLIIVEDAHYGSNLTLIQAAKALGIKTAEYQHGYIGSAHPAYNFHPNLHNQIQEFLPNYFLTHGKYWSGKTDTPSSKISIGLPDLSKRMDHFAEHYPETKKVLFISGGTIFEPLTLLIESSLPDLLELGYEVILRPHPSELPALKERYASLLTKNVMIDTNNLYETLSNIEIVISMEVSTVLYEAICFTKKVYMMETDYTGFYEPASCFMTFKTVADLLASIKQNKKIAFDSNYFWDERWKENYIKFIENSIGVKNDCHN